MRASIRLTCVLVAVAFVASAASSTLLAAASDDGAATGIDKLEPELRTQVRNALKTSPDTVFQTIVFMTDDADMSASMGMMAKGGAAIDGRYDALGIFSARMTAGAAMKVASLGQVEKVYLDGMKYLLPSMKTESTGVMGSSAPADDAVLEGTEVWWASTSAEMGAEDVWDLGVTGTGVRVAVLDTGCDVAHADLADAVVAYRSFTSEEFHDIDGHGTATAEPVRTH